MTPALPCPRCEKTISAADEDGLVARMQDHVAREHEHPGKLSRRHILARLHRLEQAED